MSAARSCSRCRKSLTDAASMECGVGPICRKLDSALLAKLIPTNPSLAKGAWSKVLILAAPPETIHTLTKIDALVQALPDVEDETFGADFRETVKQVEWVLSHSMPDTMRAALMTFVEGLGYVGLVAMWLGDAAAGLAVTWFHEGRLWLAGPKNKGGRTAFKTISGWKFHGAVKTPGGANKAAWSAPANQANAFVSVVKKHWPNNAGLPEAVHDADAHAVEAFVAAKDAASNALPLKTTPTAPPTPKCSIAPGPSAGLLFVRTPYNAAYVGQLKTLPPNDRAWNKVAGAWVVAAAHESFIKGLVHNVFGETL
jgi:hypothetical protein